MTTTHPEALQAARVLLAGGAWQHPPIGLDPLVPDELPFGRRRIGAYSPCAFCLALAPLEGGEDVIRLPGGDIRYVPESTGTWLRYGETPICPRHAGAIVAGPAA